MHKHAELGPVLQCECIVSLNDGPGAYCIRTAGQAPVQHFEITC